MSNIFSKQQIFELEKNINYSFKNISLIQEALSHPSLKQHDYSGDEPEYLHKDYERLEFLGDSILGFIVTELLFRKFTTHTEGNIAKMKAHLVSKSTLCEVANEFNLADFIIMTKGEESSGGRTNMNNIENTMESLLAAIYLDSDIETVKALVSKLWQKHIENIHLIETDPKTRLQEWAQSHKYSIPDYEIIEKTGLVHLPNYTIRVKIGHYSSIGYGNSIKSAEKDAAKNLLLQIKDEK